MNRLNPVVYHIDKGIEIQIQTNYRPELSSSGKSHYFEYTVRIKNLNDFAVQILRRHWEIFDSIMSRKVIDGEGVVGEQPTLEENQFHQYTSYTMFFSEKGSMSGYYTCKNLETGETFESKIPQFDLFHPALFN